jgi:CopG family transcriptional regulator, nickel-responsive regulator
LTFSLIQNFFVIAECVISGLRVPGPLAHEDIPMKRVTITIDDDLMSEIDHFMGTRGYETRSEVLRDLAREGLRKAYEDAQGEGDCVASLTYVYDHGMRDLAKRLCNAGHDHHDIAVATTHIHLNHESCVEVSILRGAATEVRHYAEHIMSERGVRHGRLVTIPIEMSPEVHVHANANAHEHKHALVRQAGSS